MRVENMFLIHTTQYNTIQHNTTQYNTIQHNTTQRKYYILTFQAPENTSFTHLRSLFQLNPEQLTIAGQAAAIEKWQIQTHFCGLCGSKTQFEDGGYRLDCVNCKEQFFPRTDPVVIMLVHDGTRYAVWDGVLLCVCGCMTSVEEWLLLCGV